MSTDLDPRSPGATATSTSQDDDASAPTPSRTALLVVDLQEDFLPGGPLGVPEGDAVLQGIRRLMDATERWALVVATQDWHPPGHVSFASSYSGRQPFDEIELHGHPQTLWPDHCLQGTPGAELHQGIHWTPAVAVIRKGEDPSSDSYSAFRNNWDPRGERPPTGLAGYLRERGIASVVVVGLARDVCARWTALDARQAGFETWFVWDLTRPVDPKTDPETRRELEEAGVRVVDAEAVCPAP